MKWLLSLFTGGSGASDGSDEALIEQYRQLRKQGRESSLALIRQLPPPAVPECGKKLGLYKSGTLILNQDDELAIVYDYCLHHYRRAGKNVIERALENTAAAQDSPDRAFLQALMGARFSVFCIEDILPHRGARLRDLITGDTMDLTDLGLSSTGQPGILLTGRLLRIGEITLSSGTLIPVPEPVYHSRILAVIQKFIPEIPTAHPELSASQSAAMEAQIQRIALHEGGEDNVFYTDVET